MQTSRVRSFFYLVHDLARQARRWQERVSHEQGLTMPQLRAVTQLCNHDGISQAELANLIDSDPMTVSGVVERLEARGLVRRAPHPTDSRAKIVLVTDQARAVADEVRAKIKPHEPEVFRGVTDADLETTLAVLEQVGTNLQNAFSALEETGK